MLTGVGLGDVVGVGGVGAQPEMASVAVASPIKSRREVAGVLSSECCTLLPAASMSCSISPGLRLILRGKSFLFCAIPRTSGSALPLLCRR